MRISRTPSQIAIALYLMATLFLRFEIEAQLQGHLWISLGIGAFCVLFLYALIKSGFLNPGWFGWEKEPSKPRQVGQI